MGIDDGGDDGVWTSVQTDIVLLLDANVTGIECSRGGFCGCR